MKETLVVVAGATGIGKTELSIRLANHLQAEIVSADSRQVYRELKIGTAAPTDEELSRAKHHLVGNKSVHDYYSAGMYEEEVLRLLPELFRKNPFVVLTGGSGMYIDAVCEGMDYFPDADTEIRARLIQQWESEGVESLRFDLKRLDPTHYFRVDLSNPKRILKALEVCWQTGQPYSSFLAKKSPKRSFRILKILLERDRELLYERIDRRVCRMMELGLEQEAFRFRNLRRLNALNTVGYKELFPFFEGEYDREEAVRLIQRNSRRYAKRQMTWFARDCQMKSFAPEQEAEMLAYIEQWQPENNQ